MSYEVFKAVVRQGFVPIFVAGKRDVEVQLSGCRSAGLRVIEYTQRREDSAQMIPSIVQRYPDMHVLVGSTLDDDGVVRSLNRKYPHLRTLAQLSALGASGFVSRMSFSEETCRRWRATHFLMPCAGTVNEAYRQFCLGAHIIKVVRSDYEVVRQLATTPAFGFCPLFVTGGMNLETIPSVMADGVLSVGAGFDAIMGDCEDLADDAYHRELVSRLKALQECTLSCREKRFPGLTKSLDAENWRETFPFALHEDDINA